MVRLVTRVVKLRSIKISITLCCLYFVYALNQYYWVNHFSSTFEMGWILLSLVALLALFNIRKKLSFIPLGNAYLWSQFHYYIGISSFLVFLFHINYKLPNGIYESILAFLFLSAFITGLFGLYISRRFPPKLVAQTENVIYERLPALRAILVTQADNLIQKGIEEQGSKALFEFYLKEVKRFLERSENFWLHAIDSQRVAFSWVNKFKTLDGFLNDNEKLLAAELENIVNKKIELDIQYAKRSLLKRWLFVHIPLSYGLVIFLIMHVLLVYGFLGVVA